MLDFVRDEAICATCVSGPYVLYTVLNICIVLSLSYGDLLAKFFTRRNGETGGNTLNRHEPCFREIKFSY